MKDKNKKCLWQKAKGIFILDNYSVGSSCTVPSEEDSEEELLFSEEEDSEEELLLSEEEDSEEELLLSEEVEEEEEDSLSASEEEL